MAVVPEEVFHPDVVEKLRVARERFDQSLFAALGAHDDVRAVFGGLADDVELDCNASGTELEAKVTLRFKLP